MNEKFKPEPATNEIFEESRILGRKLARQLTEDEQILVSGGGCGTKSTCSSSDNNSCDMDVCNDSGGGVQ